MTQSAAATQKNLINLSNVKIGLVISLLVQPFEVIRTTSIMSKKPKNINISGTMSTVKEIFRTEGVRGFFRGGALSVTKSTLNAALFFTGIENAHLLTNDFKDKLNSIMFGLGNSVDFFNACAIKASTTFLVSPLVVIKTRFEVAGVNEYSSIRSAFVSTYKKEGLRGFYKGVFPTLLRDVPYSGIQYSCYRFLLDAYSAMFMNGEDAKGKSPVVFTFSAFSSIFAVMLTYPFDNLRVRHQCSEFANFEKNGGGISGWIKLVEQVYNTEGIRGFYAGYVPRLMKKALSTALMWTLYEKFKKEQHAQSQQ